MVDTLRNTAIKDAALLRERIVGCVRAAPAPMKMGEIHQWPSVHELAPGKRGYVRVVGQVQNLARNGTLEMIGRPRSGAAYRFNKERTVLQAEPPVNAVSELNLQIDRKNKSVRFVFEGVAIKIDILS